MVRFKKVYDSRGVFLIVIVPKNVLTELLPLTLCSIELYFSLARLKSIYAFVCFFRRILNPVIWSTCFRLFLKVLMVLARAPLTMPVMKL